MNLLALAVIVVCAATAAVAAMYVVRRRATVDEFLTDTTRGSAIFGVIGTAFAVLLAFVMFVAFDSFNGARESAQTEAAEVENLFRTADFFPAGERERLQGDLVCYGRAVIHDEWDAMHDGEYSVLVDDWLDGFEFAMRDFEPRTESEQAAYRELFIEAAGAADARRERLLESDPVITPPVWFILALGGILTVAFVVLFTDRRESFVVQGSMIGFVAALVSASLVLVWFLDHPYQGSTGSIEPDEMERTLEQLEHHAPDLRPPCDEEGVPTAEA